MGNLGIYMILIFFVVYSTCMLSDSKHWENDMLAMAKPMLGRFPWALGKITHCSKCIVQTIGTIGILLSFATAYGCKCSTRLLAFTFFIVLCTVNLPTLINAGKETNTEALNLFKNIAILGGLLQVC